MKRRPLNLLTVLSLVAFTVVAAMWVRSNRHGDNLGVERIATAGDVGEHDAVYAYSSWGAIELGRWREWYFEPDAQAAIAAHATGGWHWSSLRP